MDINYEDINFLMIDERIETPKEIVEDFMEIIKTIKDDDEETLRHILVDFFDEVSAWNQKDMWIQLTKMCMGNVAALEAEGIDSVHDYYDEEIEEDE